MDISPSLLAKLPFKRIQAGFSLIELLVVLVLIALVTTVVFPNFVSLYSSTTYKTEREDVLGQIADLGFGAYTKGKTLVLKGGNGADVIIEMPNEWLLEVPRPIVYRLTGVCLGGVITIQKDDRRETYELKPPHCKPSRLN